MDLIVQPDDGVAPLLEAINKAKKSLDMAIFRFDLKAVGKAAEAALRQEFEPSADGLVVSPEDAREQLATFIKRAKKSLAIYGPKVSDTQMLRLLNMRAKAGVDIRVIGKPGKRAGAIQVQKLPGLRLHVPTCAPSSSMRGAKSD